MEIYTLDRDFKKQHIVENYQSTIWTERYYGDGEFELFVPADPEMLEIVKPDTLMAIDESDQPMIVEAHDIDAGVCKATGIALPLWLNNRPIRSTNAHKEKSVNVTGATIGSVMASVVQNWCIDSIYLDGTVDIGLGDASILKIPGLSLGSIDSVAPNDEAVAIPFGPVYDPVRAIAEAYQVGLRIVLAGPEFAEYGNILFDIYKGLDRTSDQAIRPTIRFSPGMNSLADIKEIKSITDYKNLVYSFATQNPGGLATTAGVASTGGSVDGFDLRVLMTFEDDITTETVGTDGALLTSILQQRAYNALKIHAPVALVDGRIVPNLEIVYGEHYNLGDIVETEGYSGTIQKSRVTEYIRSKDASGYQAYPTLSVV